MTFSHLRSSMHAAVIIFCSIAVPLLNADDMQTINTMLVNAAKKSNVSEVKVLFNMYTYRYTSLPARSDTSGYTALHWAAHNNCTAIAKELLSHRAFSEKASDGAVYPTVNPSAPDAAGDTPLHVAAKNDSYEIAQLILETIVQAKTWCLATVPRNARIPRIQSLHSLLQAKNAAGKTAAEYVQSDSMFNLFVAYLGETTQSLPTNKPSLHKNPLPVNRASNDSLRPQPHTQHNETSQHVSFLTNNGASSSSSSTHRSHEEETDSDSNVSFYEAPDEIERAEHAQHTPLRGNNESQNFHEAAGVGTGSNEASGHNSLDSVAMTEQEIRNLPQHNLSQAFQTAIEHDNGSDIAAILNFRGADLAEDSLDLAAAIRYAARLQNVAALQALVKYCETNCTYLAIEDADGNNPLHHVILGFLEAQADNNNIATDAMIGRMREAIRILLSQATDDDKRCILHTNQAQHTPISISFLHASKACINAFKEVVTWPDGTQDMIMQDEYQRAQSIAKARCTELHPSIADIPTTSAPSGPSSHNEGDKESVATNDAYQRAQNTAEAPFTEHRPPVTNIPIASAPSGSSSYTEAPQHPPRLERTVTAVAVGASVASAYAIRDTLRKKARELRGWYGALIERFERAKKKRREARQEQANQKLQVVVRAGNTVRAVSNENFQELLKNRQADA